MIRVIPGDNPVSTMTRGGLALLSLAVIASVAVQVPMRGELLALFTAIAGSLAVGWVVPCPERRPILAVVWSALAFALPVLLALANPTLPLALTLSIGSVGVWVLVTIAGFRRLPLA